jgi:hypothetical protein
MVLHSIDIGERPFSVKRRYLPEEEGPFCGRTFWLAFWHPACYTITCEALEVRRAIYLWLVVSLVQLSGLRVLCVPRHGQAHPCCPMPAKTTLPSSSPLPDCCASCILNCQGSVAEARNTNRPSEYAAQSAAASVGSAVPFVAINTSVRQLVSPSISPPLSPLSQSCLLLI